MASLTVVMTVVMTSRTKAKAVWMGVTMAAMVSAKPVAAPPASSKRPPKMPKISWMTPMASVRMSTTVWMMVPMGPKAWPMVSPKPSASSSAVVEEAGEGVEDVGEDVDDGAEDVGEGVDGGGHGVGEKVEEALSEGRQAFADVGEGGEKYGLDSVPCAGEALVHGFEGGVGGAGGFLHFVEGVGEAFASGEGQSRGAGFDGA